MLLSLDVFVTVNRRFDCFVFVRSSSWFFLFKLFSVCVYYSDYSEPMKRCYWTIHSMEWLNTATKKSNVLLSPVVTITFLCLLFSFSLSLYFPYSSVRCIYIGLFTLFSLRYMFDPSAVHYDRFGFLYPALPLVAHTHTHTLSLFSLFTVIIWKCHGDENLYLYRTINFIWLTSGRCETIDASTRITHCENENERRQCAKESNTWKQPKKSTTNPTLGDRFR